MKTSFSSLIAAASLAFTSPAFAQDDAPNTDFDQIDACFKNMQVRAVSAIEKPAVKLDVYASGQAESATCSLTLRGGQDAATKQDVYIYDVSTTVGQNSYSFTGNQDSGSFDTKTFYQGVSFEVKDIPDSEESHIEINGPAAKFAESIEELNEEKAKGNVTVTTNGENMTIVVAKGSTSDWIPDDAADNMLSAIAGSAFALNRFDQRAIVEAAKKSAAQKSSIIVMQPQF